MVSNGNVRCLKRLEKEKIDLISHNDVLTLELDDKYPQRWFIKFKGAKGSLYENEEFKLRFVFGEAYVNIYFF